jgi:CHASE3 domain sensor protein
VDATTDLRAPRRRRILLAVVAPPLLLTIVAAVLVYLVVGLLRLEQWVDHTDQVIAKANDAQRRIIDQETGLRGFLLARDPTFLDPLERAAVEQSLGELRALVGDNPLQVERADELLRRYRSWRADAEHAISEASVPLAELRRRKDAMDEIRARIAAFVAVETGLRDLRTRAVQRRSNQTLPGVLVLLLVAGAVLAGFTRATIRALIAEHEAAVIEAKRSALALREAEKQRADELERAVIARTAELAAVNRELEAFSYSVSHDLRAPLRAIDGFSNVLVEDYANVLDAEGRDALSRVRAAAKRMAQLIDDLLELSRVTRAELTRTDVDVSALAENVLHELRRRDPGERSTP